MGGYIILQQRQHPLHQQQELQLQELQQQLQLQEHQQR
jgi:hypothetical protein